MSDDREVLLGEWLHRQGKNGMVVLTREEWRDRLDQAATDGYASGRDDQREESIDRLTALLTALLGARSALREAEHLLGHAYGSHGLVWIDGGEGELIGVEAAAYRMGEAVAAIDAAIGSAQ